MEASRYWCHMCSRTVNPTTEMETIKCPICQSGFVEEMAPAAAVAATTSSNDRSDSDRSLPLWAPILLGMLGNPRNHLQPRRMESEDNQRRNDVPPMMMNAEGERSCNSTAPPGHQGQSAVSVDGDNDRDGGRRLILINPFNQTIIIQGSNDSSNELYNRMPVRLLGDYFIGLGLDLLLQHLAENDPNRQGTPPAQKEAVDALPTVKVEEAMQCCVCLDECKVGAEVKEMPCKHKFHSSCIVAWLELHSSCPVCRYKLPADDESKLDQEVSRNSSHQNNEDNRNENGRRLLIPLMWPLSSLLLPNASQTSGGPGGYGNSSLASPSTNAPQTTSRADEN